MQGLPVRLSLSSSAFTLVELSIVLVILGLLVGGVLSGQSLIKAAELRSIQTQHTQYITAVNAFKDKYFGLPGDLENATDFWGEQAAGAACVTTSSPGALTCNGNGNGRIDDAPNSTERFRFWQHLANAGLIEGRYDGITHGVNEFSATPANVPSGRQNNSLWYANYVGVRTSLAWMFDGDYGNALQFGAYLPSNDPGGMLLTAEDAWNIDIKMDEGMPARGYVTMHSFPALSACTSTADPSVLTATYRLSNPAPACVLFFRKAF